MVLVIVIVVVVVVVVVIVARREVIEGDRVVVVVAIGVVKLLARPRLHVNIIVVEIVHNVESVLGASGWLTGQEKERVRARAFTWIRECVFGALVGSRGASWSQGREIKRNRPLLPWLPLAVGGAPRGCSWGGESWRGRLPGLGVSGRDCTCLDCYREAFWLLWSVERCE